MSERKDGKEFWVMSSEVNEYGGVDRIEECTVREVKPKEITINGGKLIGNVRVFVEVKE